VPTPAIDTPPTGEAPGLRGGLKRWLYQGRRHQPQFLPPDHSALAFFGILVAALVPILALTLSSSSTNDDVTRPTIPRQTPVMVPSSPDMSDASPAPSPDGLSAISVPVQPPLAEGQTASPSRPPSKPPAPRPPAGPNLAARRPTIETSHTDVYVATNAVDGNANTYWESANRAFPQSLTVDLGSATSVSRIVLKLPPVRTWPARTQTLSVLGSTDGSRYSTIVGPDTYTFNPATGNAVTIAFATSAQRFLRLTITANTEQPGAQVAEFEVYAS
jgi:hypothetical protein